MVFSRLLIAAFTATLSTVDGATNLLSDSQFSTHGAYTTALAPDSRIRQTISAGMTAKTPYRIFGYVYLSSGDPCVSSTDMMKCPVATVYADDQILGTGKLLTTKANAWNPVSGTAMGDNEQVKGLIQFSWENFQPGKTFQVKDASFVQASLADWRGTSDAAINANRKRDVKLVVGKDSKATAPETLVVAQKFHSIPFGAALSPGDLSNGQYTTFFKNNFNYATDEYGMSNAWENNYLHGTPYDTSVVSYAASIGIKTRGHTVFGELADWFSNKDLLLGMPKDGSESSLQAVAYHRLKDWLNVYAGRVGIIEVVNEMLNGRFWTYALPCGTSGPCICDYAPACANISNKKIGFREWAYTLAHQLVSNRLSINDYCVLNNCAREQSALASAIKFAYALDNGSGGALSAVAEQGHILMGHSISGLDMQYKIYTLGVNLPSDYEFWITELDCEDPDVTSRADGIETMLRACFSSAYCDGTILWTYWAGQGWRPNSSLLNTDFSFNTAGDRIFGSNGLLSVQWKTNYSTTVDTRFGAATTSTHRSFHGDYTAYYGANKRCSTTFNVPVGSTATTITLKNWKCTSGSPPS